MQRIIKGDQVVVIAGRDRGTKGTVLSRVDDRHIIVEGVNVVKKAVRPNPALGVEGGIVDKTLPIDQSNVMLVNPKRARANASASRKLTVRRFACSSPMAPLSVPRPNEGDHVAF